LLSPRQWPVAAVWPHDVRFGRSALIAAQCRTMRGSVGA
jgi:hypothetical protein